MKREELNVLRNNPGRSDDRDIVSIRSPRGCWGGIKEVVVVVEVEAWHQEENWMRKMEENKAGDGGETGRTWEEKDRARQDWQDWQELSASATGNWQLAARSRVVGWGWGWPAGLGWEKWFFPHSRLRPPPPTPCNPATLQNKRQRLFLFLLVVGRRQQAGVDSWLIPTEGSPWNRLGHFDCSLMTGVLPGRSLLAATLPFEQNKDLPGRSGSMLDGRDPTSFLQCTIVQLTIIILTHAK